MKPLLRAALARILIMRCRPPSPWIIVLSTLIWLVATHCAGALAQAPQAPHGQLARIAVTRPEACIVIRPFNAAHNAFLANVLDRDNSKDKLASSKYYVYSDQTHIPRGIRNALDEADPSATQYVSDGFSTTGPRPFPTPGDVFQPGTAANNAFVASINRLLEALKYSQSLLDACEADCDAEFDAEQRRCEWQWKMRGRDAAYYRACIASATTIHVKCYQECARRCT